MTKNEIKQQKKNEALNKIRKLYGPNQIWSPYPEDGSYSEQRDNLISRIIEDLNKELNGQTNLKKDC